MIYVKLYQIISGRPTGTTSKRDDPKRLAGPKSNDRRFVASRPRADVQATTE
eukprot:SAG22_NODE_125_length_18883_cov_12.351629_14_plen_52_part_00